MIKTIDTTELRQQANAIFLQKVQELSWQRRSKMTQLEMAKLTGVSLKTIQRFESYQVKDAQLLITYNLIVK